MCKKLFSFREEQEEKIQFIMSVVVRREEWAGQVALHNISFLKCTFLFVEGGVKIINCFFVFQ